MNPVPLLLWLVAGSLLALVPRFVLGWSWWAALGAGLLATPPFVWLVGAVLDRIDRAPRRTARPQAAPALSLGPPDPCPRCGSSSSAHVLYGVQAMTKELEQAIADGRAVLAGCLVYAGAPAFVCRSCRHRHGRAEP